MLPLVIEVEPTPLDPSHWKTGVSVTPLGSVTEQVRVTVSPAMMEDKWEEVREIVARSGEIHILYKHTQMVTTQ